MPFTFAHPAAAVPLRGPLGRYAVLSALVIGSLAPDFSYFLPFRVTRVQSHSLFGLFWFCMPAGVIAYALFHGLLARPLVDLLPHAARVGCEQILATRLRPTASAVLVSLFAGAVTHIAWDAFTHAGAPIVRVSRTLRLHLWTVSGYPISVYTILQHLSTVLGLVLLVVWIRAWLRTAPPGGAEPIAAPRPFRRSLAWMAIAAATLALWLASGTLGPPREPTLRGVQLLMRRVVPAGIESLAVAVTAYAIVWRAAFRGMLPRAGGS